MSVREQVIFTDKAELILLLKARVGREPRNIAADQVQSIRFSKVKGGLFKKEMRQITIVAKGVGTIEYDESTHKQYFDSYVENLRKFAKENNVTFYDFD